jgi:hypothetical protein
MAPMTVDHVLVGFYNFRCLLHATPLVCVRAFGLPSPPPTRTRTPACLPANAQRNPSLNVNELGEPETHPHCRRVAASTPRSFGLVCQCCRQIQAGMSAGNRVHFACTVLSSFLDGRGRGQARWLLVSRFPLPLQGVGRYEEQRPMPMVP